MRIRWVNATFLGHRGWAVQWKIEELSISDKLWLYASNSPQGPWDKRIELPSSALGWVDEGLGSSSLFTRVWWFVEVRASDDTLLAKSRPVTVGVENFPLLAEIIRRIEPTFRSDVPQPIGFTYKLALYRRSSNGTPCPMCVDHDTGEVYVVDCTNCSGSRKIDRWYNPIEFRGHFITPSSQYSVQTSRTQNQESEHGQIRMSSYPIVESGDIIVQDIPRETWKVLTMVPTKPMGVIVSQTVEVERLLPGMGETSLPFPGDDFDSLEG